MRERLKNFIKRYLPPGVVNILRWLLNKKRHQVYRRAARKILSSAPVICDPNSGFEIHVLTCERDFMDFLWAMKTFYHYSGLNPNLIIHDDGTLDSGRVRFLKAHFRNCTVIPRADADIRMKKILQGYEFCTKFRFEDRTRFGIRLFDPVFYSRAKKILFLDSDILFFKTPLEIIECIKTDKGFFITDCMDAYSLSYESLRALCGFEIEKRLNAGMIYFNAEKIYDLALIESALRAAYEKHMPRLPRWAEQTAWAAMFSRHRHLFLRLPDTYQIFKQPITDKTISHHFVIDDSHYFYIKGLRHLESLKFFKK